ncbi:MAG: DUF444 family protein [Thermodesulfobacteriota bacterium]|nr:DUF444 family protein [Thermodesulfobacteriota bacterium]
MISAAKKIERDLGRFKRIVRGKIKKNLKKYITQGELIGKRGKDIVSIPLPQIDIPTFRYSPKKVGGVGQGEGDEGTPLGPGSLEPGQEAGELPGDHILEVDVTIEELADILGEELGLPNIEPKGKKNISTTRDKYTGISRSGPESLKHFKRTYKEAIKRQLISGSYNFENPRVVPVKEDKRYRSWQVTIAPESNAVILYMMDVSGSMGDEQKDIVRTESFWIDTWLRTQYKGIETRYIIHDAAAREVDRDTFFSTRESGGTKISSAYELCDKIIDEEYPPQDWNIYPFHFSDGDNWGDDTETCIGILKDHLLEKSNLFCYGQVEGLYGSGSFKEDLKRYIDLNHVENLATSEIRNKDEIYDSIKEFLGRGR